MLNGVGGSLVDTKVLSWPDSGLSHLQSHLIGDYKHKATIRTVGRNLDFESSKLPSEYERSLKVKILVEARLREEIARLADEDARNHETVKIEGMQNELLLQALPT